MNGLNGRQTRLLDTESECGVERRGGRKRADTITPRQIRELIDAQQYRCALTGEPLTPKTAVLDHIVPLSRGGEHSLENAQVVADWVNKAKGSMTQEEFIEMCLAVASKLRG